ncbi:hypothetical protein ACFZBU_47275 [Embleya sp. NPDC008237]|uniref:hypothetical protein n=1 Tax=Embleya sp. NPDC008237 TaxID=3363978 RepID=UPI0036E3E9CE
MPVDPDNPQPHEPFDLRAIVLLVLAGGACLLAYRDPARWGVALAVGVTVLLALHTLVRRN